MRTLRLVLLSTLMVTAYSCLLVAAILVLTNSARAENPRLLWTEERYKWRHFEPLVDGIAVADGVFLLAVNDAVTTVLRVAADGTVRQSQVFDLCCERYPTTRTPRIAAGHRNDAYVCTVGGSLIRLHESGAVIFDVLLPQYASIDCDALAVLSDDSVVVAGPAENLDSNLEPATIVARYDRFGTLLWSRTFDGIVADHQGLHLFATQDDRIILSINNWFGAHIQGQFATTWHGTRHLYREYLLDANGRSLPSLEMTRQSALDHLAIQSMIQLQDGSFLRLAQRGDTNLVSFIIEHWSSDASERTALYQSGLGFAREPQILFARNNWLYLAGTGHCYGYCYTLSVVDLDHGDRFIDIELGCQGCEVYDGFGDGKRSIYLFSFDQVGRAPRVDIYDVIGGAP